MDEATIEYYMSGHDDACMLCHLLSDYYGVDIIYITLKLVYIAYSQIIRPKQIAVFPIMRLKTLG